MNWVKPAKEDSAATARIFYCTFRDFADKWRWVHERFSKDAILRGSFDKFAESSKAKRGTSEVDAAFLETIEGWRLELACNLALRNPNLTQRDLNFSSMTYSCATSCAASTTRTAPTNFPS